jgi:putative membrane protein
MLRKLQLFTYASTLALTALHCESRSSKEETETVTQPLSPGERRDQPAPAGEATRSAPGTASSPAAPTPPASALDVKPLDDGQIAAITDAANSAEIETGRLAQSKAQDKRVRDFAAMMVEQHGRARQDQQGLGLAKVDSMTSQNMMREATADLQSLQQKSGAEFDRAYMQMQVESHREVLDTLRRDLLPAAKDARLETYLQTLEPRVQAHLAQAQRIQTDLGASMEEKGMQAPSKKSAPGTPPSPAPSKQSAPGTPSSPGTQPSSPGTQPSSPR